MKERKLNLQMFSDDNPAEDNQAGTEKDVEIPEVAKDTKATEQQESKKYTDEEVDKIINQKFSEWEKKQQKAVDEAKKLAEMNAQEKAEYERDMLNKELADLKRKDTLYEMTKQARLMLNESEVSIDDDLLNMLVSDSAETTKKSVESFVSMFKGALEKAVKDALKGNSPTKKQNNGITKEQILNVKNAAERQKLIAENIDLFD